MGEMCSSKWYRVGGGFQVTASRPRHLGTKKIVEPDIWKGKKVSHVEDISGADNARLHVEQEEEGEG